MEKRDLTDADRARRAAMGARLRQLREQTNLSLDELARLAGIGQPGHRNGPTIGSWEREGGVTFDTALKVVETLAGRLGRSKAEVLAYIAWG
jgi:transcriptional regulator with XRE-family HTH domain